MKRRRLASGLVSLALSAVLLAVLFGRLGAGELTRTLAAISLPLLGGYAGVALAAAILRAARYRILLRPRRIGWGDILMVTLVRNAFDDLLPARVGSLSYIYVLNRRLGFAFDGAASSFVVAFVFDFLTLGPFVIAAVLAVGSGPGALSSRLLPLLAVAFTGVTALVVWKLVSLLGCAGRIYEKILRALGWERRRAGAASLEGIRKTLAALEEIRRRRFYGRVLLLSLLIRLAKYVSLYILLLALLSSRGWVPGPSGFFRVILALTGAEMTSALPVKGLAGFGTWESAWALAFGWTGFDPALAVISGLGLHLISNIFEYGLGLGALLVLSWPGRRRGLPPAAGS